MAQKTAVITGGGTGIGLEIAISLKTQGYQVAITGRRDDVLQQVAAQHDMLPITMDVRQESTVINGMAAVADHFGKIDVIIANAGIAKGQGIRSATTEFWRDIMATNLDGAFFTIREGLKHMPIDTWGRVIAISSVAGVRGLKGAHAYTASKHGVVGLIRALSADFAQLPVTFNAICPGYVDTDIITRNIDHIAQRSGVSHGKARKLMVDLNPHGRLITPAEVAGAVTWLCGPGSDSVDGQTIEITGGV